MTPEPTSIRPRVTVVIPAYNEGTNIVPVLDRLREAVTLPCEVLVVVDTPDDTTLPVIQESDHLSIGPKSSWN